MSVKSDFPMVRRFQKKKWGMVRCMMDGLEVDDHFDVHGMQFNNAQVTARRLRDAYEGTRQWTVRKHGAGYRITRIK